MRREDDAVKHDMQVTIICHWKEEGKVNLGMSGNESLNRRKLTRSPSSEEEKEEEPLCKITANVEHVA
jgi:hypothetical protein